ncbi:unnamed protein product [Coccothraustes coccothraustes]
MALMVAVRPRLPVVPVALAPARSLPPHGGELRASQRLGLPALLQLGNGMQIGLQAVWAAPEPAASLSRLTEDDSLALWGNFVFIY